MKLRATWWMIYDDLQCPEWGEKSTEGMNGPGALRNDVVSGIKLGTFGREEGSMAPRRRMLVISKD